MFKLTDQPIDPAALRAPLAAPAAGALATFEGWVRDHQDGRAVAALHYEAYEALAQSEGEKILAEARARFAIIEAACVHRVGELAIGDLAVWVGVTAGHRAAAFDACRYVIDEVKSRVPIWKKEQYADGASGWVNDPAAGVDRAAEK